MLLYLVRHGEAKGELEDIARPLSDKGVADVNKISVFLSKLHITVAQIHHSNKLRAVQTAKILSEHIKSTNGTEEMSGLLPMDEPRIWFKRLETIDDDVMLVGHLPHLGGLACLLLCGNRCRQDLMDFKAAGACALKRSQSGFWSLEWFVTPNILTL